MGMDSYPSKHERDDSWDLTPNQLWQLATLLPSDLTVTLAGISNLMYTPSEGKDALRAMLLDDLKAQVEAHKVQMGMRE